MSEHDDGMCWCDDSKAREVALDRLYPDRCQIPGTPDAPNAGIRTCVRPSGHVEPCNGSYDRQDACHFCGQPYDGEHCAVCWISLDGMNLADIKALFADIDLSIDLPVVTKEAENDA